MKPESQQKLVAVFSTRDEVEAELVRGLLEEQGIDVMLKQNSWARVAYGSLFRGGDFGKIEIQVLEAESERSREIIRWTAEPGDEADEEEAPVEISPPAIQRIVYWTLLAIVAAGLALGLAIHWITG